MPRLFLDVQVVLRPHHRACILILPRFLLLHPPRDRFSSRVPTHQPFRRRTRHLQPQRSPNYRPLTHLFRYPLCFSHSRFPAQSSLASRSPLKPSNRLRSARNLPTAPADRHFLTTWRWKNRSSSGAGTRPLPPPNGRDRALRLRVWRRGGANVLAESRTAGGGAGKSRAHVTEWGRRVPGHVLGERPGRDRCGQRRDV